MKSSKYLKGMNVFAQKLGQSEPLHKMKAAELLLIFKPTISICGRS